MVKERAVLEQCPPECLQGHFGIWVSRRVQWEQDVSGTLVTLRPFSASATDCKKSCLSTAPAPPDLRIRQQREIMMPSEVVRPMLKMAW